MLSLFQLYQNFIKWTRHIWAKIGFAMGFNSWLYVLLSMLKSHWLQWDFKGKFCSYVVIHMDVLTTILLMWCRINLFKFQQFHDIFAINDHLVWKWGSKNMHKDFHKVGAFWILSTWFKFHQRCIWTYCGTHCNLGNPQNLLRWHSNISLHSLFIYATWQCHWYGLVKAWFETM